MSAGRLAALALGAVLVVAAVAKLARPGWAREGAAALGVPVRLAAAVPVVELVLGSLLVAGLLTAWAAVGALVLLALFTLVLVRVLRQGERPRCGCFGSLTTGRVSWWSVARNGLLGALAVLALWA